jgi:hypothetical protein
MQQSPEHFVTLHDSAFMPLSLCLYSSLVEHSPTAHLTVVCMDDESYGYYFRLNLSNVSAVSPREWMTEELCDIKASRNRREFCWTMASHSFEIAWKRHPDAERFTYVDADLCFFSDPKSLIDEMLSFKKSVLITEHAYDPRYDQSSTSGIYCVQFITFSKTATALVVLREWQRQCVECCSETRNGVAFGDQMYLNTWPTRYTQIVHVYQHPARTLAPWNIDFFCRVEKTLQPVFYHFHSLRLVSKGRVLAWESYRISAKGRRFYLKYLQRLSTQLQLLAEVGYVPTYFPPTGTLRLKISTYIRALFNIEGQRTYLNLPMLPHQSVATEK